MKIYQKVKVMMKIWLKVCFLAVCVIIGIFTDGPVACNFDRTVLPDVELCAGVSIILMKVSSCLLFLFLCTNMVDLVI